MLGHLGDSETARADVHAARAGWLDATSILEDLDDPDADRFRARLAAGG